jgi:hypothetical protein
MSEEQYALSGRVKQRCNQNERMYEMGTGLLRTFPVSAGLLRRNATFVFDKRIIMARRGGDTLYKITS